MVIGSALLICKERDIEQGFYFWNIIKVFIKVQNCCIYLFTSVYLSECSRIIPHEYYTIKDLHSDSASTTKTYFSFGIMLLISTPFPKSEIWMPSLRHPPL